VRPIDPSHYYRNFLHPRYWPTWLLLFVLYLISFLPHKAKQALGTWLGMRLYKLGGSRYKVARGNIRACFPDLTEAEQEEMIRKSFISNAMGYMESTVAWWRNFQPFLETLEVHGKEHLDEAIGRGKGVLLLGAHFSIIDFAGPLANHVTTFNYMYRPQNNKLLNAFIERSRRRYSGVGFTKRELKDMIEFIKQGNVVWYAPDQDSGVGPKRGIFAPLFGVQAATLTTPAWIARETGATVLQLSQFREENGVYSVHYSPIYEGFPSDDELENCTRLNKGLEEAIKIHPEQYLWLHRRFKTRPEGEPSLYD
jgi:Kdo2-lipid IVA lauroyltransferase/acyltransferase